jgi:transcriptional regulator with XRE-family HTH domain
MRHVTTLGEIVRSRRGELGLTQKVLSERAKISERAIKRIEKGETLRPEKSTLDALARCLEITPQELQVPPAPETLFPPQATRRLRELELGAIGVAQVLEDLEARVFQLEEQVAAVPARAQRAARR